MGFKHTLEIGQPGLILGAGEFGGGRGRLGCTAVRFGTLASGGVGTHRVLDIFERGQHAFLPGDQRLFLHGVLHGNPAADAPAVEQRRRQTGGQRTHQPVTTAERRQAECFPAERTAERERRVAIGLAFGGAGNFGLQRQFGRLHVRALAQGIGRNTDSDGFRCCRQGTRFLQCFAQGSGRASGEQRQTILGRGAAVFKRRNRRAGLFETGACLRHVERRDESGHLAPLGDLQGLGLAGDISTGNRKPLLASAQGNVFERDLGG